jgi:micrococcal nuclease
MNRNVVVWLLLGSAALLPSYAPAQSPVSTNLRLTQRTNVASVKRVVDGDTLLLLNGERVRLIGVDTPETVDPRRPVQYFGKEASAFTRKLAEGQLVRLEYDWDTIDKYGRTLAYVYLADGRMLNSEIIKQGYGHAYTRFPFKYMEQFRRYERTARDQGLGLWKPNAAPVSVGKPLNQVTITGTTTTPAVVYDVPGAAVLNAPTPTPTCAPSNSSAESMVYVTSKGTKYHRAGCSYLSNSAFAEPLSRARANGFTPCSKCNPPTQ